MTGLYPWRFGEKLTGLDTGFFFDGYFFLMAGMQRGAVERFQPDGLNTSLKILPEYLKEAGYSTHAVGKVIQCLTLYFRIMIILVASWLLPSQLFANK